MTYSDSSLEYVTGEDGKNYIGVLIPDNADYVQIPSTDVGLKFRFEIFAMEAGDCILTFIGAATTDTHSCAIGHNQLESIAIPAGTTAIRVENGTNSPMWLVWADILEEGQDQMQVNRGVLYVDEYDATLEKIEL